MHIALFKKEVQLKVLYKTKMKKLSHFKNSKKLKEAIFNTGSKIIHSYEVTDKIKIS